MSVKLWSWDEEKCGGDFCPGSCYGCDKANDGEHFPIEALMAYLDEAEISDLSDEEGKTI